MQPPRDYAPQADLGDFRLILDGMAPEQTSVEDLSRRQAAMLAFARRASAQPEISVLMQDAMALLSEALGTELGGVGEILPDGRTLVMRVAATDKHGKLVNPITHDTPLSAEGSMAGFALNAACPVVIPNLSAEKRFTDLLLRRLGVISALCVPLSLGEEGFGVLGAYAKKERHFTNDDVYAAETVGHLLTASVARTHAEMQYAQQRELTSSVLEMVDSLCLTLDLHGTLLDMNQAGQRVTGFSLQELRGKPIWQTLLVPEEVELVRGFLSTSTSQICPCEFESGFLTNSGTRRRAVWSLRVVSNESGHPTRILMIGNDRTQQMEMECELRKTREIADRATRMVEELRSRVNKAADLAAGVDLAKEAMALQKEEQAEPGARRELRASPRLAYHYYQLIAPLYTGNRMPPRKEFFPVECNDISAGGLSFLFDRRPDFEFLVVALGRQPEETFFTAHVVRVAKKEQDGNTRYLVGCRFTGRISL